MITSDRAQIRIVIADDHTMFREALRLVLTMEGGFAVVAEASDGHEAVRRVLQHRPDVLVLDLNMPRADGFEALRQLRAAHADARVVLLTGAAADLDAVSALTLGAHAVLSKDVCPSNLCDCVRSVARGGSWVGHDQVADLIHALRGLPATPATPPTPAEGLTPREREVVEAVLGGATNRDIGIELGVSQQTVKNHLTSVFNKLGVSNRVELALYATYHHLSSGNRALHRATAPGGSARRKQSSSAFDSQAVA